MKVFEKRTIEDRESTTDNVFFYELNEEKNKIKLTLDVSGLVKDGTKITAELLQRYEQCLHLVFGYDLDNTKNYVYQCVKGKFKWVETNDYD